MRRTYLKLVTKVMSLEETSPLLVGSQVKSLNSNVGFQLREGSDEAGRVKANDWEIWDNEEE